MLPGNEYRRSVSIKMNHAGHREGVRSMRKIEDKIKKLTQRTVFSVYGILHEEKAENFVDSAIKILIAVVIGALLLAGLYKLFADSVLPILTERVMEMFNYSG